MDRVQPTMTAMTSEMLEAVAGQFRALAEPSRLHLLQILMEEDASVNDLARRAGLSQANASKHLALLTTSGFVTRRKQGNRVVYSLADPTTRALCDLMCQRLVERSAEQLRHLTPGP